MIGEGACVEITEPEVVAPADGTISFVFDTKHAIGFRTSDGIALLIHVGIDTVALNGKGFKVFVKAGDSVKKGDLLMRVDLDYLRENAPSLVSPVVCTELDGESQAMVMASGMTKAGELLLEVHRK